jgi:hypothetical protein
MSEGWVKPPLIVESHHNNLSLILITWTLDLSSGRGRGRCLCKRELKRQNSSYSAFDNIEGTRLPLSSAAAIICGKPGSHNCWLWIIPAASNWVCELQPVNSWKSSREPSTQSDWLSNFPCRAPKDETKSMQHKTADAVRMAFRMRRKCRRRIGERLPFRRSVDRNLRMRLCLVRICGAEHYTGGQVAAIFSWRAGRYFMVVPFADETFPMIFDRTVPVFPQSRGNRHRLCWNQFECPHHIRLTPSSCPIGYISMF